MTEQHIIKDPIYGTMNISRAEHEFIKPFLDHPHFQRLRHIKQLSFVDLIFPGAVHTRFSHSLGCSYLCSRIFKQLNEEKGALSYLHRLVILAGLLHDIGHGPFSHVFEETTVLKDNKIKHEDWFGLFINDIFSNGGEGIVKHIDLKDDLLSLFNKDLKQSSELEKAPWVKSILSSQLDADRMDYILRDSISCGVKYGQYDLDWLISCMELEKTTEQLVILESGMGSVEQLLHARSFDLRRV